MKAISYTAARENLAATMDQVCSDRDPVVITRKRNQSVVLLSLEDYEALEETAYLLRVPANARRLQAAIESLERGRGLEKELVDPAEA
jgi:antitoxin YefM